ncbi:MAG: bacillithiol biosynthesis cysteine-adding enzyme BshC [Vicingaceae bacterium]|jgi:bacillithiol biosynthesis cysteine-adding enzyme BshC
MKADCIPFEDTGYFSNIILDYLSEKSKMGPFYSYNPTINGFKEAIEKRHFSDSNREILVEALQNQYQKDSIKLKGDSPVTVNIDSLINSNTFSVTTGHQLCLFTGPLYFIYKIVSTVRLCKELSIQYPEQNFVPVYWMATEDHDFEEINHFKVEGKKFTWETDQKGAVGRMKIAELKQVFDEFSDWLPELSNNANELRQLFENAYLKHSNLAAATRYLVHQLFEHSGVIIVDGDDKKLKTLFAPIAKRELIEQFSSEKVNEQSEKLSQNYKIQVNPREINLFYLVDGLRERIVKDNRSYSVNDTSITFTEDEILIELRDFPERFSPNVILRPVYQESILPNLAYIGGGGELAYWFQLKTTFEAVSIPLPVLILRNSVAWLNSKQSKFLAQLEISNKQFFYKKEVLLKEWVKQNSSIDLELKAQKVKSDEFFSSLRSLAGELDASLNDHVAAIATKQSNALAKLSEKMIRAERRKSGEVKNKIDFLKDNLFPNNGLQERTLNFSEIYLLHGKEMINILHDNFVVPANQFLIIQGKQTII